MVPVQCRMGRVALSWGVRDLAAASKVSPDTVARFERGEELREATITKLQTAMERAGVEFIGDDGVKLTKRKGRR